MADHPFYQATLPTLADGEQLKGLGRVTNKGELLVASSIGGVAQAAVANNSDGVAGSGTANKVAAVDYIYVFNGTTWDRMRKPNASSRLPSAAASVNSTVAKASAGDLWSIHGYNAAAAVRFLKLYNKATAPTVGTDIPIMTFALAPSQAFDIDCYGHYFSAGISYALTVNPADADTTALTAADIVGMSMNYA